MEQLDRRLAQRARAADEPIAVRTVDVEIEQADEPRVVRVVEMVPVHEGDPDTLRCGFDNPPAGANVLTVTDPATGVVEWQRELAAGVFPAGWSPDGQFILLDDAATASPIWRLAADGSGDLEVVVDDGRLLELVPVGE